MKARTASDICIMYRLCEGSHCFMQSEYLSTPQRAMHSSISLKSSVAKSEFSPSAASSAPI